MPDGFLLCDGSELSRSVYSDLFSVIGTKFGAGNGRTTYNLPKLDDARMLQGNIAARIGTQYSAGLPNITGTFNSSGNPTIGGLMASGCFYRYYQTGVSGGGISGSNIRSDTNYVTLDASRSSAIYGASSTVQPIALDVIFIIKYSKG